MTDETQNQTQPDEPVTADGDRFEVKWRKKSEPAPQSEAGASAIATATEAPPTVEALQRELDQERERVKNLQDRWQRAAADLANLRRRTEEERGDMEKFSSMLVVSEMLPVLDNFERALSTIPGNLAMLTWIQGIMLIERHFLAVLERQGLAPIEVQGRPFTPYEMEAVSERETDEAPPGTVLQEYQKGYTMHGRVIRPALVEVAAAPVASSEPPAEPAPNPSNQSSESSDHTTDTADTEAIAEQAETDNAGP